MLQNQAGYFKESEGLSAGSIEDWQACQGCEEARGLLRGSSWQRVDHRRGRGVRQI